MKIFERFDPIGVEMARTKQLQIEKPNEAKRAAMFGELLVSLSAKGDLYMLTSHLCGIGRPAILYWFVVQMMRAAVSNGQFKIVEFLLNDCGLSVNNPGLEEILFYAINSNVSVENACKVVTLLVTAGADINHQRRNDSYTLMHCAAKDGDLELCEFLIESKCSVNGVANDDSMPLTLADKTEDKELIDFLESKGAVRNWRDINKSSKISDEMADLSVKDDGAFVFGTQSDFKTTSGASTSEVKLCTAGGGFF
eukprot:TRINITY_DN780100_c0_g1_i1.p1 TRINITY_DN780100_c0_g1~~TRINITY_DN780100_c0_g1_i1.p1  ORF type:complete len:253 (-),score=62.52 TRINITY_DN780100_c0_g1_i1:200-958(-)